MYPWLRIAGACLRARNQSPIGYFDRHETDIRVYPGDIDIFGELNNGRALTLYDIPRISMVFRNGLWRALRRHGIGLTIAGSSVRYQRRVTLFQKLRVTSECVGYDDKFFYLLQNMYRGDEPIGQALLRGAFIKNGLVSPKESYALIGASQTAPELPDWVVAWTKAEAKRPWPPE